MKSAVFGLVSGALLLAQDAAAVPGPAPSKWVMKTENGQNYACKCHPGDPCWPDSAKWRRFNNTVNGNLQVHIPPGAACYNTFEGPFGVVNTYNEAECQTVTANWYDEQFQIDHFAAAGLWTYFTNDTCRPTTNPSDSCTLGYYGPIVLNAKKMQHIKAGVDFARQNNLRLVIRNTGHDFLGRSVGWGSLIINTHSLKDIKFHKRWMGGCGYSGPAVTLGAGVQAFEVLEKANKLNPPKVVVTGECATVGVSGGLVQGGGHGPFTNFHGFLADTALEFKVVTADGQFRTASPRTNSDLFWALKGGGPGAFGVIVEATFKLFDDKPSAGVNLDINLSGSTDPNAVDLFWNAVGIFHSYSTQWVDEGLYVYYELGTMGHNLRVHPFVGIGKTPQELAALLQPMFNELNALGVPYTTSNASFPTFYDLYNAMFEAEVAGNSALTGGWTLAREDVEANPAAVVDAFKKVLAAGSFMVGHMWNAGRGLPQSQWSQSAINPRFRHVVDKLITIVPVGGNAPLNVKAEAQNRLTNVVDKALRDASPNGCSYVNEADPFTPNWQDAFWGTNYPKLLNIKKKYDPEGVFYAVSTPGTENWEQIETGTRLCKKL
ncbi:hypothetical protein VTJ83DRAFT_3830 [Remersonia thermophila]|uniref:FAD-binding PCMH-type domain-containing protein n=1 Tax=Remersonia thermophila TaxID=72144 RepID=A0ABR4DG15_9PEZI